MDLESAFGLLDILCENANRIIEPGYGLRAAESTFFEVVGLIRSNEQLKPYVLRKVSTVMKTRDVASGVAMPSELVELLAHEFRWPEFKDLAEQRLQALFDGDRLLAMSDLSDHVILALQDNWECRTFYRHYEQETNGG